MNNIYNTFLSTINSLNFWQVDTTPLYIMTQVGKCNLCVYFKLNDVLLIYDKNVSIDIFIISSSIIFSKFNNIQI